MLDPENDEAEQVATYLIRNHKPVFRAAVSCLLGHRDAIAAKSYSLPKASPPSR
jgi:hypothetical protein